MMTALITVLTLILVAIIALWAAWPRLRATNSGYRNTQGSSSGEAARAWAPRHGTGTSSGAGRPGSRRRAESGSRDQGIAPATPSNRVRAHQRA
jgi:hypothetical protein